MNNFDPATYSDAAAPTIDTRGLICTDHAHLFPGGQQRRSVHRSQRERGHHRCRLHQRPDLRLAERFQQQSGLAVRQGRSAPSQQVQLSLRASVSPTISSETAGPHFVAATASPSTNSKSASGRPPASAGRTASTLRARLPSRSRRHRSTTPTGGQPGGNVFNNGTAPGHLYAVPINTKTPYNQQYSLGMQTQFSSRLYRGTRLFRHPRHPPWRL